MEDRLTELELKFSFQDQLLEELRDIVTQQQYKIDELTKKLKDFEQSQKATEGNAFAEAIDEPPPPHY